VKSFARIQVPMKFPRRKFLHLPVLERAANGDVVLNERSGASEDFSFMLNDVPGQFFS
jgi:hypothetical protein